MELVQVTDEEKIAEKRTKATARMRAWRDKNRERVREQERIRRANRTPSMSLMKELAIESLNRRAANGVD